MAGLVAPAFPASPPHPHTHAHTHLIMKWLVACSHFPALLSNHCLCNPGHLSPSQPACQRDAPSTPRPIPAPPPPLQMLASGALPLAERLQLLASATTLLQGQGEALNIDRRQFYCQLYEALALAPLSPLYQEHTTGGGGGAGSAGGPGGAGSRAVGSSGERVEEDEGVTPADAEALRASCSGGGGGGESEQQAALLACVLESMLLGSKQTDMGRLAALVKRLAGLLLASGTGEAMGSAALLLRLLKRYSRLAALLEWEGGAPVGGRVYDPVCPDPSEAGGLASGLWELTLASQHYHPAVASAARMLLSLSPGAGANGEAGISGALAGAAGPQELAVAYDAPRRGGFKPAPAPPPTRKQQGSLGGARRAARRAAPLCEELVREVAASGDAGELAAVAGTASTDGGAAAGAAAAAAAAAVLRQHYLVASQQAENARLRHERALLAAQLSRFHEHLVEVQAQRQRDAAAAKATKAAAAEAAAAGRRRGTAPAVPVAGQQPKQRHSKGKQQGQQHAMQEVQQPRAAKKQKRHAGGA